MSQTNKKPESSQNEFSFWRSIFFPIHRHEIFRFVLACALMALLLFSFTTVRIIKDSVVVNAPGCSAQSINAVKTFFVIPSAILTAIFFSIVRNGSNQKNYATFLIGFFGTCFALYAFVFLPYIDYLHPDPQYISSLQEAYPIFADIIALFGNWTHAFFYVAADISGNFLITYAFWLLIGEITNKEDTSRMFPLYGMYGNITGIVSAGASGILLGSLDLPFVYLTQIRIGIVSVALIIAIILMRYSYEHFMPTNLPEERPKIEKKKLGFVQSLMILFQSKFILYLAIIVTSYGLCINFAEVTFKACLKLTCANPAEFMNGLDNMYIAVGITTFIASIIGKRINKSFGWFGSAIGTPVALGITTISFFMFIILSDVRFVGVFADKFNLLIAYVGFQSALNIAVFLGMAQNVLSKATKYVLLDPAVQSSYLVLDGDLRKNGKLAVDGVAGRIGKSGGAAIQFSIATLTGFTQIEMAPIILTMLCIVLFAWGTSVYFLDREYTRLLAQEQESKDKQS
jgi:AAA family ATP:ADP antiporter